MSGDVTRLDPLWLVKLCLMFASVALSIAALLMASRAARYTRRAEAAYARARSAEPPPKRAADGPVVRATNPPSIAVRVDDAEIVLTAPHPLFSRIDLIAERGRGLFVIPGELDRPDRPLCRPPLPAGCEFLAYVHVHRALTAIMDCHIETDVPVYCEDR